jgi:putative membrane protein
MTAPNDTSSSRKPRVFAADDPALITPSRDEHDMMGSSDFAPDDVGTSRAPVSFSGGIRWGALFLSAMFGLASIAASVSFARFVSQALARNDWIGWTSTGLLAIAALAALIILVRELFGLFRLARLGRLRRDADAALLSKDKKLERSSVRDLRALFAGRPDMRWRLARLSEHEAGVNDAGDLLRLADREVLAPLDATARRLILASAKRVSTVTALSPMVWIAMGYVLVENLRMLRALAGLYGGRPGGMGALRLGRMVVGHIIASGGVTMTDDLLGQFLGQDLLRRLSRRLGEGAFNGALTARIGVAAIDVTRPLPFIDAAPVRVRDIVPELFKRTGVSAEK